MGRAHTACVPGLTLLLHLLLVSLGWCLPLSGSQVPEAQVFTGQLACNQHEGSWRDCPPGGLALEHRDAAHRCQSQTSMCADSGPSFFFFNDPKFAMLFLYIYDFWS